MWGLKLTVGHTLAAVLSAALRGLTGEDMWHSTCQWLVCLDTLLTNDPETQC